MDGLGRDQADGPMGRIIIKWLGSVIAGHTLLQLVATPPLAYFIGLAADSKQEAEAMFDALPPQFWPILATLVLLVVLYPGFIAPIRGWRREKKEREDRLRRETKEKKDALLERTYWAVANAQDPKILDESNPDRNNESKLLALAIHAADEFVSKWEKDDTRPPPLEDENGLVWWHVYLRELRMQPLAQS